MAQEYVITIRNETDETSQSPVASQNIPTEQQGQPKNKAPKSAGVYIASKALAPAAKSIAMYATTTVGIETGSQELQQKTDFALSTVQMVGSTFSTIMGTAAVFGGPAGVAIGAAISAVSIATQLGIKQAQRQQAMKLEEEQLQLYRSRFGMAYNQSRNGGAV